MRKLAIGFVGAALIAVALASAVQAGSGPRLNGAFKVTGTVVNNDIGIPAGTTTTDVYTFKSTCGSGGCPKVLLTRSSGGRNIKSTLHKVKPGVYKGPEGPAPYTCVNPIGAKGEFSGENKIVVTSSKKGLAQKISGKTVDHFTGCKETVEEVSLKGKLAK